MTLFDEYTMKVIPPRKQSKMTGFKKMSDDMESKRILGYLSMAIIWAICLIIIRST